MSKRTCSVPECERPHDARGYCSVHYMRWRRTGDPIGSGKPPRIIGDDEARFWQKVSPGDGCWEWRGWMRPDGYGGFDTATGSLAHRFSYELLVAPIPDGLCLDHLCRNRRCVNPAHLEPVTLAENKRRGNDMAALNRRKTLCKRGHPLPAPQLLRGRWERVCAECAELRSRQRVRT